MKKYDENLFEYYLSKNRTKIDFKMTIHFIKEVLFGLQIIHASGYVHNDLKLQNIMLKHQK